MYKRKKWRGQGVGRAADGVAGEGVEAWGRVFVGAAECAKSVKRVQGTAGRLGSCPR